MSFVTLKVGTNSSHFQDRYDIPDLSGRLQMPPRPLTAFEAPIAVAVVALGHQQRWEFAAYLETPAGPLIEIRTLMRDDGADPSQDVHIKAAAGARIVVHHNHLSQESLSFPDWNGLATAFDETFAHCADGTVYWGRVRDSGHVMQIVGRSGSVEVAAENHLFAILNASGGPAPAELAHFFRKEVVNRSMRLRNLVDYDNAWGGLSVAPYVPSGGTATPGPVGILGKGLQNQLDQAASRLAPSL